MPRSSCRTSCERAAERGRHGGSRIGQARLHAARCSPDPSASPTRSNATLRSSGWPATVRDRRAGSARRAGARAGRPLPVSAGRRRCPVAATEGRSARPARARGAHAPARATRSSPPSSRPTRRFRSATRPPAPCGRGRSASPTAPRPRPTSRHSSAALDPATAALARDLLAIWRERRRAGRSRPTRGAARRAVFCASARSASRRPDRRQTALSVGGTRRRGQRRHGQTLEQQIPGRCISNESSSNRQWKPPAAVAGERRN